MIRFGIWAFIKNDTRDEIGKKFRGSDGSGFNFVLGEFDISWSRPSLKLALNLARRVKKAFPKTVVDVVNDNGNILFRNGKAFSEKNEKAEKKKIDAACRKFHKSGRK